VKRRNFIHNLTYSSIGLAVPAYLSACSNRFEQSGSGEEYQADILIVGGGLGGCAAALSACRQGVSVIMTEPTNWIGGQVSQQGVPPDEHQWIESFGRTENYARFRTMIRDYYRNNYHLSNTAMQTEYLNPGNGMVSRLCHEPKAALAVLQYMLEPYIVSGHLRIFLNTKPVEAFVDADSVRSVSCIKVETGKELVFHGEMFIDASEEGDLLPLTGTEYVLGAESRLNTGEPHAPEIADPGNIQALTWCFAIDHLEGEDHTIEKPLTYDFWKNHIPALMPQWSGKLLSLNYSNPRTLEPRYLSFVPPSKTSPAPETSALNLWLYRRIIDKNNFQAGSFESDITLVNWPQNDYMLGNITDVPDEIRNHNLDQARQLSLSLLYWLQTEVPRPDGKQGWKGLRLRKDMFGTDDGLARYPYIRESRRIRAEFTIREQDLSLEERKKDYSDDNEIVLATPFHDSVGIGYYHLDLHPSTGGDNYIDMASVPFQIPLGAMIPQRMKNIIPGCKNIGTTHISNGCYRLHPVEWSIGEVAGHLCAYSIRKNKMPRVIRNNVKELSDFQSFLAANGIELEWSKLK
jgi:hypothetical protein